MPVGKIVCDLKQFIVAKSKKRFLFSKIHFFGIKARKHKFNYKKSRNKIEVNLLCIIRFERDMNLFLISLI